MSDGGATDAVNTQVIDAVRLASQAVIGDGRAVADQIMLFAVSLAMQNAVAQQQQQYVLRNAITAAAARGLLASSPEAAIALAREALSGKEVVETLASLRRLIDPIAPPAPAGDGGAGG